MFTHRVRVAASGAVALVTVLAMTASVASAHAQYGSSAPAANATVSDAPTTLQITYTQELADIKIAITGPDGSNVTTAPAKFDLANRKNVSVPMQGVGPGTYTVVWHNVSGEDGDPNDGSFVFTVAGAAPQTATAPAAPNPAPATTSPPPAAAAAAAATRPVACIDNGVITPGIADFRVNTYCKRQAIRDQYKGKINELLFNYDLSIGMGLESSLKDAMGQGG